MTEPDTCPAYDILLLEDAAEDVALYTRLLSRDKAFRFNIFTAQTVAAAIAMVAERSFDGYVIDYSLPDGDGLVFLRHMLDRRDGTRVPAIVMVTGQGNEEVAVEALKLGAMDYLTKKGISDGVFIRPLVSAIERARLIDQVKHYQEELEHSNAELSEFAHTASHDLKAPIRRILSYCDILKEDAAPRLNGEDIRILDRITMNARRMQNLVNDLLVFSLMEYEKEEKRETDLFALVQDIVDECEPQITENGATITIRHLPVLSVYPTRMRQIFSNLISNALKYKSAAPPAIAISHAVVEGVHTFCVKDNGLGIPPEHAKDVFKDFKRLHTQEEIEGTGLGLPICKRIAERHGGKIWVESEAGKGSAFYFTIPDPAAV